MTEGFVYFCGYDDMVKIGKSTDPVGRVQQHNVSNPKQVELYTAIYSDDMAVLEKRLHHHFRAALMPDKHEWFHRTKEMSALISFSKRMKSASDFEVGLFLGSISDGRTPLYDIALATIDSLKRRLALLESHRRKLWVLEAVVQSLGLRNYPVFADRFKTATQQMEAIDDDDPPMFIWKDGSLEVISAQDYRIIFPIPARIPDGLFDDDQAPAA